MTLMMQRSSIMLQSRQVMKSCALILHVDNSQSEPHEFIHVWCDTDFFNNDKP